MQGASPFSRVDDQRLIVRSTARYRFDYVTGFLFAATVGAFAVRGVIYVMFGFRSPTPLADYMLGYVAPITAIFLLFRLLTDPRVRRVRGSVDRQGVQVPRLNRRTSVPWLDIERTEFVTGRRFPYIQHVVFVLAEESIGSRAVGSSASIQLSGSDATIDSVETFVQEIQPGLPQLRTTR